MKLKKKSFNLFIVGIALVFCVACSSSDDDNDPKVLTGQFIDAEVGGINYKTETQEGMTNSNGEFRYIAGETVVFSIGDINFPSAPAARVLTPCDLAGTTDTSNTLVVNMARLLQSLDTDGNPANGITISTEAHTASSNLTITIEFDSNTFDTDVANVVANGGSTNVTLIDAADATDHLDESIADISDDDTSNDGDQFTIQNSATEGNVTFKDDSGNQIAIPNDAWVRLCPVRFQNEASWWLSVNCKVNSDGSFGGENNLCYTDDELILDALADINEKFQVVVYKEHISIGENHWDCGEDIYKYVGNSVDNGNWGNIIATPSDYEDRSGEDCSDD